MATATTTTTGTNGNDTINGGAGNDMINSGNGNDYVYGGAGSDTLHGGAGDDTLDGGSGSDSLDGGSGNDVLVYRLAENQGATDLYTGGAGIDTVRILLTGSEWLLQAVQNQIGLYVQHLITVKTNNNGEVSNGNASDFTFHFGSGATASNLTVSMMERLEIYVNDIAIDYHKPIINTGNLDAIGAVTEDLSVTTLGKLIDTGHIGFYDVDFNQTHTVSAASVSGNPLGGTLVPVIADQATGDGMGTVGWTYQVNNSATQKLAAGQTATESFVVTVLDSAGKTVTQTVSVTVTGTNDAPTITAALTDASGAVAEDAASPTLSDTGTIAFNDVDLTDGHSASVVKNSGTLGGNLTLGAVSGESASTEPGAVSWTYQVANSATQYLAAGQTATEKFTVTVSDGHGGTVDQVVEVTVTGTNDAPTITLLPSTDVLGAVTEDASPTTLSDTGTINFNDIDLIDVHSTSVAAFGSNTLGGTLTMGAVSENASTGPGSVGWTYQVANSATQYLALGQTATEKFTVTVSDGHGGTVAQLVTVTVTGTNDAPTITAGLTDASGAVAEDASSPTLSDTGTIAFNDLDLIDVHSTSVAADAGNTLGGTLTMGAVSESESASTEPGSVGWTYQVANSAVQYLAYNETATEKFTVSVSDGHGGTVAQLVTVTVTGTNDAPTITAGLTDASGAVTEDASVVAGNLSDSGTIAFNDLDLIDVHSTSVAADAGNTLGGTLTMGAVSELASTEPGSVGWTYQVANSAVQYLAYNETATEKFTVSVSDGHGGTVDQVVEVTVTGSNDAPTITAGLTDASGAVAEDASSPALSDTGTIAFNDLDLIDVHSTSVAADAGNTLGGTLTMGAVSESASTEPGSVGWTYQVANSAVQYLAYNETATEKFTVSVSDGHGGTVDQVVEVTVTGSNDAPTITTALTDASGAVTEDATTPNLSDSGTIAFNDIDLIDGHSTSVVADGANTLGGTLTLGTVSELATTEPGSVGWTYQVANSAVQYLAYNETATEKFTVTVSDGHGGTVDQVVEVTVTGTNDAPTITTALADASGAVTEDATTPNLSDSGTIAFNDLDLIDGHSTSVVADGANTLGGTLTLGAVSESASTETGSVGWTYQVANSAVQYLAYNETATEKFTVSVSDGHGGTVDQVVEVTVTGTNDAPTIVVLPSTDVLGAVTEDAASPTLSDTGTIAFNDLDLIDGHSTSVVADGANTLGGTLTLGTVSELATTEPGSVGWTYQVANSATQYLAAGQTATEKFTVTVSDGHGGTVDQVVEVTVTGTNDAPTITLLPSTDVLGAVTEDASPTTLSDTGTINFNDIDLIDGHTTSVAAFGTNPLGGTLTMGAVSESASTEPGSVGWTYQVANSATQYLALGQTATEKFTVTVSDGHGGTVDQVVEVTVTGTNDAPTITTALTDASGAVTEDATTPNLSDSGTIAFNDLDLIDVHSTSVAADAGNTLGGTLTMGAVSESASTEPGSVGWTYQVANSAVQYLAYNETATEKFTVTVSDGHGGTVDQVVEVTVTGTNDAPTITTALTDASGAVTEDAASPTLSDTGTIAFNDIDLIDVHSTSVAADAGNTLGGTLTMGAVSELASTEPGTVGWTYQVANSATQYLALGQTATEKFTVSINDGHGGTVDQVVEVTVTGTNDAPTIVVLPSTDVLGAVTEDAASPTLSDTGTIAFNDLDLIDGHSTSVVADGANTLGGTLTLGTVSELATTEPGSVGWTYQVANSATQYLAAGQTATEKFTVTVSDGHGGTVDQVVEVTVTGTNDAPTIVVLPSTDVLGAVTEDAASPTLSDTGTIAFNDLDLIDGHSTSVVADGANTLGGTLTLGTVSELATTEPGSVGWTYQVANSATQYLALGQTATEKFTVTVSDGHGGTVDQVVEVTVTGTNDAPTITTALTDASGAVTEDATTPNLSDSGTIAFNDLDLIDVHSTSVAADAGNTLGGTLTMGAVSESASTEPGSVGWTYQVANSAVQYLAYNETATEKFTVTVSDGHGGTVDQVVEVTVTGTNDAPTITTALTDASGAVTEDAASPTLSDTGTIAFNDIDLIDVHSTSVAADAGNTLGGTLTMGAVSELASTEPGTVGWTYQVANSATQYLALGQTATEKFTVSINDGHGGTVDQVVEVTVTGTNDAPTIVVLPSTDVLGAVTEDAASPTLSDTGTIAFNDLDLIDGHSTSVVADGANTLGGTLTLGTVSELATTEPGSVGWTYQVANSATQYLAAGQTATEKFTVTVSDGHGGTVDQVVEVTVTGTNDAPTIVVLPSTDVLGAVTEDAASPTLSDTGTIAFNDLDLIDGHSTSVVADGANTLGGTLTLGTVSELATTEPGSVGWTYQVANSATQYLALGQTATEKFTVTVSDGHGGTVDQVVEVTVTGTNDAPTITTALTDASGAVTEDATTPNLSDSGTIAFNDLDLIDVHSTSVAADAGNTLGGTLTMGAVSESASTEPGSVGWTYQVANSAVQYLAYNETATEKFTVTVSDGHGGTVDQVVEVTVTGTNDAPTITTALTDASGAVTEDAASPTLSDTGTIAFNDIDLIDVHSTSVAADAGNTLGGTLTMGAVSELASTEPGTVGWTYQVANSATQYLALGQTATEKFTVSINDGHGGTVDQVVEVTVTGTNDAPTIVVLPSTDVLGAVTEDAASPTLSDTGTIAFNDLDLIDGHSTSVVADGANTLGGTLTLGTVSELATTEPGSVGWTYQVANSATQYLAAGQTATEKFTVTVSDGHGGTVDQVVEVTVTGTNDAPTITLLPSTDVLGAVTEDASPTTLSDTGTINFNDIDLIDGHTTSVAAFGTNPLGGTLTLGAVSESASTEPGTVGWTYQVANSAVQYLAAGQTATEKFTVSVSDGHGGTVDQVVEVTVTGTNDAPTITLLPSTDVLGAVTEDASPTTLSDSGTINFNDIDLIDGHTTSVAAFGTNPLGGTLTMGAVSESASTEPGSVGWTYQVANSAVQYLAYNETATEKFTVTVSDDHGGTVDQVVEVTVTGTNDAPTITLLPSTDVLGAVTEDASPTTLSDSGTINFNDIDLIDGHTTSVAAFGTNPLGGTLTMGAVSESASTEPGTVGWTYQVANSAVQYLAAGQTATEKFTVSVSDGHGGTVDQVVEVTVTGTNDAPTIVVLPSTDVLGAVTEDAASPTLSDTGTIAFNDLDLIDGHSTSVVADGANTLGGTLTLGTVSELATTEPGSVGWTYQVANSATQYLAAGQTATEKFTVTVSDGHGGTVDQVVEVTVTGTNDAPTITLLPSTDVLGAVTEDAASPTLSDTGTIAFNDLDLIDGHSTSVVADGANTLGGTLTLGTVSELATTEPGSVGWTYQVANSATQYLALGQTATEKFTVSINDGHGGTVDQVVEVTVTGTNDAPTITAGLTDASGAVTEDATTPNLSDSGTITFNDLDLIDVHSTSVAAFGSNTLGGTLTMGAVSESASTEPGSVGWTYQVANSAVQYLAYNETATEKFTVTVSDGHGGTVDQVVEVTITGSNDAVLVSGAVASGAVVEDATAQATGTVNFTDVDLSDDHSVSTAAVSSTYATAMGSFSALETTDTTGTGTGGMVSWTYAIDNAAAQQLANGQVVTEVHRITFDDNNGDTVTQDVTITITGSNDEVLVSGAVASGAVVEDGTAQATGTVNFTDVDLSDDHSVSTAAVSSTHATAMGSFSALETTDTTGTGTGGVVSWTYAIDNAAAQQLANGQVVTEVHRITLNDNQGDTVTQDVTITITGSNDAPILNATATPAGVTALEDAGAPVGAMGTLVSALVNLNPPAGGLDNVSDVDTGAVTGIAITATDSSHGTWWYSINGGSNWLAVGAVTDDAARLLAADANTRVYFQANTNYDGQATLTLRAWDQTSGSNGGTADTTPAGGSTAFSTATDTAVFDITPVIDGTVNITAIASDSGTWSTDFVTNDTALTVSGTNTTLGLGERIQISTDGSTWVDATQNTGTTWSYVDPASHGTSFTYFARVVDASATVSGPVDTQAVTIDTAPPAAPAITGFANDTGSSNTDHITNDNVLAISGTAEANSLVTVFDGATNLGTTTANGAGAWTINTATLPDATHNFTATATDLAGNTGAASSAFSVTIDTTAAKPTGLDLAAADDSFGVGTSGTNSDNLTRNASGLTITGTGEEGALVTLFDDANGNGKQGGSEATLGTGTVTGGNFSIDIALGSGLTHVVAFQTDIAGNVSNESTALDITVDTTAPAAPVVASITNDTGSSNTDEVTSDNQLLINGTAQANSGVEVFKDGLSIGVTTANGAGAWSFDYTGTTLADGSYNFSAKASDAAGNSSVASANLTVVVDTVADAAPTTSVVINDGDGFINNAEKGAVSYTLAGIDASTTATVTFSSSGGGSPVVVSGLGNGSNSVDLTSLGDGNITAAVSVTDTAGNTASGTGDTSVKDTVADAAPTTTVVINDGDGFINNAEKAAVGYTLAGIDASTTATVTFSSTGGGSPVVVSGLGNGANSVDLSSLGDGNITAAVSVTDTAGNTASGTGDASVKDTVADAAPTTTVVINDGDGFINNAEKAAVGYTLAGIDASTTATVTFSSTGGGSPVVVSGLGNGTTSVNLTSLGDGTITASVSVTDTAGNTASGTGDTSVKDTVADAAPTTSVVINDGDGFINNAEKGAVSYTLAGIDASTTATVTFSSSGGGSPVVVSGLGNGSNSVDLTSLGDGNITAAVSVTDTAGNTASGTGDTSVKDTVADAAPTTTVVINDGDGFINNAEKAAVGYTLAGIDASTTATVTFSSTGGGSPVVVSGLGNGANSVDLSSLGDGNITAAVSVTDTAGNTASGTGDASVKDTVADAAPTTTVVINDGDGFINNAEKAAVGYTLAGIDASTTATVTFSSTGGGSPVVVSGLGNGTTSVNLTSLGDGTITASVSVTDTAGNTASGTGDTSVKDTVADAAPTTSVVINDGDGFINNAEKGAVSYTLAGIDASTTATVTFSSSGGGSPVVVSGLGNGSNSVDLTSLGDGNITAAVSVTDTAGNTASGTGDTSVKDTVADAAPTTTVVINDGDGFINNAEKAAVGYTLAGIDASTTATVTFSSTGGGSPVVVSGLGNGANSVDLSSLGDGNITAAVSVTDTAGNTASGTGDTSAKDTVAPTAASIDAVATDDVINAAERAATVTVTGTNEAGSTVTLNGNATTVVDATHWSYNLSAAQISAFGEGAETLTAVSTDAAGNTTSSTRAISVDTVAPTAATFNAVATDNIINAAERAATVTVTGTNEAGATVTLNGNAVTAVTATTWSYNLSTAQITAFGEGAETLTAVSTDAAGNTTSSTKAISVDTVAPTAATFNAVATDNIINAAERAATVTVTGTNEAGSTVTLNGNATTVVDATHWSYNLSAAQISAFGEGAETLTAVSTDAAGNTTSSTRAISVDTVAPTAATFNAVATDNIINAAERAATVTVTGTNEAGATVTLNGNAVTAVTATTWSYNLSTAQITAFGEGAETLTAVSTDAAGNTTSSTKAISVDTVAPTAATFNAVATDNIINAAERAATVTVTGTNEAGSTVTLNGNATTVVDATHWSYNLSAAQISAFGEGAETLTAVSTDAAGNTTSSTRAISVDTVGLAAPSITSITENSAGGITASEASNGTPVVVNLTGTGAAAGDTLTINWGGQTFNYTLLSGDVSGNSATVTVPLTTITAQGDGTFNVTAKLTDVAGNPSANSGATSVTVDTTADAGTQLFLSSMSNTQSGNNFATITLGIGGFDSDLTSSTVTLADQSGNTATHVLTAGEMTTAKTTGSLTISTWTGVTTLAKNDTISVTIAVTDTIGNSTNDTNGRFTKSAITVAPAGVAGSEINLALADPTADAVGPITVKISGVPSDWTFNAGTNNNDGTWTVHTTDPRALTVTTPATYAGAMVLNVALTWTNADGSTGSAFVSDNVEAYAPGNPIFAVSSDDHLTASSAGDLLVFAQPIANDVIHSFDASADKIDLIGFSGVSGYTDLAIADDANGNAVVTLANGSTITVLGVNAAELGATNFEFNVEPVTINTGTMTISDGAILPLGGIVENSGRIALESRGAETNLQVLVESLTLQGGGQLVLSDNANNVIFGGASSATLNNLDNTISGAGQIGAGQMTLVNAGTILANGVNALLIDTGSNVVTNSGMIEASGSGGLVIEGALDSSGSLWAHGGDISVLGDVSGAGSATISGTAMLHLGAAADLLVNFDSGAAGTLKLDASAAFSGSIGGFDGNDSLDLDDIAFGTGTTITYQANDSGSGGVLSLSNGSNSAQLTLNDSYAAAGLQANGNGGSQLAYGAPAADHTMLGGAANDVLVGGGGNDVLAGGLGSDTLTGGLGSDSFVFDSALGAVDTITDFDADGRDMLQLSDAIFGLGSSGSLDLANFASNAGGVAYDADDRMLFDTNTGDLYYDADGNGSGDRILFATLTIAGGVLDASDFILGS